MLDCFRGSIDASSNSNADDSSRSVVIYCKVSAGLNCACARSCLMSWVMSSCSPETETLGERSRVFRRWPDQRFSMPIQCTDRTEEVERPFSTALRSAVDVPLPPSSLASCGAGPEDRDLVDSLTKFSVKFPPSADSEYDFLNSNPERNLGPTMPAKRPLARNPCPLTEEEPVELPMPFVYPTSPSHSSSSSLSQERVRGPQQVRITGGGLGKLVANDHFLIGLC